MSYPQRGKQDESMGARAMMQAFNIGRPELVPVEQATPIPRSTAIGTTGPVLIRPPVSGFGKPPPLGLSRPSRASRGSSKGSIGVKQEWDSVAAPTKWEVKREDLEMVPEDFPLERTHRYIEGVDASVVASRISEALRLNSIEAEFNNKPPKAKCKTRDFVCFRVRLYAGNESGDPVVVEVQRRSGSTSCFMQACRAILNAAEGKSCEIKGDSSAPRKPLGEMKCLQGVYGSDNNEIDAQVALQDAKTMLRSEKRDTNILGLENLCSLTDPIKTTPSVSLLISKSIVLNLENEDIRDEILAATERDVFSSAAAEDMALANHAEQSRQVALRILANALSLCAADGCLAKPATEQSWFRECLVPNLMDEIKRAESNSCNATQAAICLYSLASSSSHAKNFLIDQGILDVLRRANGFGAERNQLLANETDRCLKVISEPVAVSE